MCGLPHKFPLWHLIYLKLRFLKVPKFTLELELVLGVVNKISSKAQTNESFKNSRVDTLTHGYVLQVANGNETVASQILSLAPKLTFVFPMWAQVFKPTSYQSLSSVFKGAIFFLESLITWD